MSDSSNQPFYRIPYFDNSFGVKFTVPEWQNLITNLKKSALEVQGGDEIEVRLKPGVVEPNIYVAVWVQSSTEAANHIRKLADFHLNGFGDEWETNIHARWTFSPILLPDDVRAYRVVYARLDLEFIREDEQYFHLALLFDAIKQYDVLSNIWTKANISIHSRNPHIDLPIELPLYSSPAIHFDERVGRPLGDFLELLADDKGFAPPQAPTK
jgi:hypothetical protein